MCECCESPLEQCPICGEEFEGGECEAISESDWCISENNDDIGKAFLILSKMHKMEHIDLDEFLFEEIEEAVFEIAELV